MNAPMAETSFSMRASAVFQVSHDDEHVLDGLAGLFEGRESFVGI